MRDVEACAAGPVRVLDRDEIEELERRGEITPVELIPRYRWLPRVHHTANFDACFRSRTQR